MVPLFHTPTNPGKMSLWRAKIVIVCFDTYFINIIIIFNIYRSRIHSGPHNLYQKMELRVYHTYRFKYTHLKSHSWLVELYHFRSCSPFLRLEREIWLLYYFIINGNNNFINVVGTGKYA